MTYKVFFNIAATALLALMILAKSAQAIDCSKARSSIETKICADASLKRADIGISKIYAKILKSSRGQEQSFLKDEQRQWVATRDENCYSAEKPESCLLAIMQARTEQLKLEWGLADGDININRTGVLELGGQKYGLGSGEPSIALDTPVKVLRRLRTDKVDAVLVHSGESYTLHCSDDVVIWKFPGQEFEQDTIGVDCVSMSQDSTVGRISDGFVSEYKGRPGNPGERTVWNIDGKLIKTKVPFGPQSKSTMAQIDSVKKHNFLQPDQNEEFYNAVKSIAGPDTENILEALWDVANGCSDCGGDAEQRLYGMSHNDKSITYSGCGWYMNGAALECRDGEALAVWEKATNKFYFAFAPLDKTNTAEAHIYPAPEKWSALAAGKLNTWRERKNFKSNEK